MRYPYVDPLNVLQAEVMQRLRNFPPTTAAPSEGGHSTFGGDDTKAILEDTLIVSINGIAQGMKNSG